jgi:hypothetical protein
VRQNLPRRESGGESRRILFMRKTFAASVVLLIAAGCSSGSAVNKPVAKKKIARPDILLVQTSGVPIAARHSDGMLSVHYAMRVENLADETIKLRQVTVQSITEGAYSVEPSSRPFDLAIEPKQKGQVEFWAVARPSYTLIGVNGPVTIRVTCQFDSAAGKFQHIVMQHVNSRAAITGVQ